MERPQTQPVARGTGHGAAGPARQAPTGRPHGPARRVLWLQPEPAWPPGLTRRGGRRATARFCHTS